jgi:hypothetical protein
MRIPSTNEDVQVEVNHAAAAAAAAAAALPVR